MNIMKSMKKSFQKLVICGCKNCAQSSRWPHQPKLMGSASHTTLRTGPLFGDSQTDGFILKTIHYANI